jgi:hypothetical protein
MWFRFLKFAVTNTKSPQTLFPSILKFASAEWLKNSVRGSRLQMNYTLIFSRRAFGELPQQLFRREGNGQFHYGIR